MTLSSPTLAERSAEQQAAIGQIFGLGVTTGTTDTTYSPSNNVTREQMASFVARMYRALDALPDPTEAPGAPTGVEVAISGEDGDALDVSWTAPEESGTSDVTGYVVQWKSGDDDYSEDNQSSADDTSASVGELTQGDTYTFRVAAESDDGQGDWSDEASGNPAVAPGLVGELTSTPGNSTLALSWTAPEDDGGSEITGYVVSWRTGRQASADTADVAGDATGYTITGLRNTANYSVWVAAVNAAGTGESASVPAGTGKCLCQSDTNRGDRSTERDGQSTPEARRHRIDRFLDSARRRWWHGSFQLHGRAPLRRHNSAWGNTQPEIPMS